MSVYSYSQQNLSQNVLATVTWVTVIAAQLPGSTSPENLSTTTVKFAFKPVGVAPDTPPSGADWHAGTWQTVTAGSNTYYEATITVGPAGTVTGLTVGEYAAWVYLSDTYGDPVANVGSLTITNL